MTIRLLSGVWLACLVAPLALRGAEPAANLAQELKPFCAALARPQVAWTGTVEIEIDGQPQRVDASFARFGAQSFDLKLTHVDYAIELRGRVKERYGQLDAAGGQWLMCRPVAMESNLHNVLFVPADGVLYVANANHEQPAAERPYVKLDLNQLLGEMKTASK